MNVSGPSNSSGDSYAVTAIEAVDGLPIITITRDFAASVEQVQRAHTEAELFKQWIGPDDLETDIELWDAKTGGHWRYASRRDGEDFAFFGSFHEIRPGRIVQTFTFCGWPDAVALETLVFDDLGDGRTRLRGQSVFSSIQERDAMISSGMDVGVNEGYARLESLLAHNN